MQNLRAIVEALGKTVKINHRTVMGAITSKLPLAGNQDAPIQDLELMEEVLEVDGKHLELNLKLAFIDQ